MDENGKAPHDKSKTKLINVQSSSPASVLAGMFKELVKEANIAKLLAYRIDQHVDANDKLIFRKKKSKNNLLKLLSSEDMSFTSFVYLAYALLQATKVDITISFTDKNGKTFKTNATLANTPIKEKEEENK